MEYAQTRVQARYGARPGEAQWRQLSEQRTFAAYLATARALPCGSWLTGIDEAAGPHQIERALRRHWHDNVAELASWMSPEWRPALSWTAHLIDWPAWCRLAQGDALPPGLAQEISQPAGAATAAAGDGRRGWIAEWQRRWPDEPEAERHSLQVLLQRVENHLADYSGLAPALAWEARRRFGQQLVFAFRAATMRPCVAFIYLLLHALDLERLRADLIARALQRRGRS